MPKEAIESLDTLSGLAERIALQLERISLTPGVAGDDYSLRIAQAHALGIVDLLRGICDSDPRSSRVPPR